MEGPPYTLIKRGLQEGKIIPFLGAGASLGDRDPKKEPWNAKEPRGLPIGSELGEHLANLIDLKTIPPDLATAAQYFEYQAGRRNLDETLNECLGCPAAIPRVHAYLAGLPGAPIIVTTNYDDLLERAFQDAGRPYDLIAYANRAGAPQKSLLFWEHRSQMRQVPANELTPTFERTVIYKFHGFLSRQPQLESQYVITEDDYIDFLSRMVGMSAIPIGLIERFKSNSFLFLGYGLADWNLRLLLNRVSKGRTKQTKSWAIQHHIEPFERPIWEQRHVNLYELSLSDFLDKLEAAK